uniref:Transmembrane protein 14C n=1 Tax=Gasterosteus aculeatus aculeatus TaxID=481459 RepID=A0AAQ4NN91_GASAC
MFGSCRLRVGGVSVSRKLSTRWQKLLCLGAVVGHGPARVRLRCAGVRGRNPRIRESRRWKSPFMRSNQFPSEIHPGSVPSLAAGLLFGLLAAVGAYLQSRNPQNVWLSLGTSGTLAVVMGLRFLNSWKFMPAGLMTLASGLMLLKIIAGMQNKPRKS